MPIPFHVSLVGRGDLAGEIFRQIRQAIVTGQLRPQERLPAIRDLARSLSVSRTTVTVAYERLAGEGLVTSRVGAGTFVTSVPFHRQSSAVPIISAIKAREIWQWIPLPTAFDRPARFDFRTGLPDADLFPARTWRRLLGRCMSLATGTYQHPAGNEDLREAISKHLAVSRSVRASSELIVITSGAQQAFDIVSRALLAPGDTIAVEDPGYEPARRLFQSLGLVVKSVPVDGEGIVIDALPSNARAVYVTPSHQYPLGVTMSLARRKLLLDWADREDAAIIEDDYDSEFRFGGRPLEPLKTLDWSGRVIYLGTFSKTLLPQLRLAFVVAPAPLVSALHRAKYVSDWYSPSTTQSAMAMFIEDGGFARHIRKIGAIYSERHQIVAHTIEQDFKGVFQLLPSEIGLHLAAFSLLHSVQSLKEVIRVAGLDGIAVQPLSSFTFGSTGRPGVVIGYGGIKTGEIREGLRRFRNYLTA